MKGTKTCPEYMLPLLVLGWPPHFLVFLTCIPTFLTKQIENLVCVASSHQSITHLKRCSYYPKSMVVALLLFSFFWITMKVWVGRANEKQKLKPIFAEKGMIQRTGPVNWGNAKFKDCMKYFQSFHLFFLNMRSYWRFLKIENWDSNITDNWCLHHILIKRHY